MREKDMQVDNTQKVLEHGGWQPGNGSLPTVDVIVPVYKPDQTFGRLLRMLVRQTHPARRIIIMNTERSYWNDQEYSWVPGLEVHHVTKEEFDHGGTRNQGASYSDADVMVFMTDDAVPQDEFLLERLAEEFGKQGPAGETVAEVYGRQMPAKDCRRIERYNREFNYPAESRVKTKGDLDTLGIKTYFASNVCCAYRRDIFEKQGGFITRTIFNEDMIYAAGVIQAGYAIAYGAEAKVIHSHNLSAKEQFHRNFDLAVSQADHPEIFERVPSEGEGIRMVKGTASRLLKSGHGWLIPSLVWNSGWKYLGYRMGKRYRRLPKALVRACSMNQAYWDKKERDPA